MNPFTDCLASASWGPAGPFRLIALDIGQKNSGTFGAFEVRCPFHKKSNDTDEKKGTGCAKYIRIKGRDHIHPRTSERDGYEYSSRGVVFELRTIQNVLFVFYGICITIILCIYAAFMFQLFGCDFAPVFRSNGSKFPARAFALAIWRNGPMWSDRHVALRHAIWWCSRFSEFITQQSHRTHGQPHSNYRTQEVAPSVWGEFICMRPQICRWTTTTGGRTDDEDEGTATMERTTDGPRIGQSTTTEGCKFKFLMAQRKHW